MKTEKAMVALAGMFPIGVPLCSFACSSALKRRLPQHPPGCLSALFCFVFANSNVPPSSGWREASEM
ncbi:hypothetical protein EYF80_059375 [Liparis tanakae]|uniref:Uncharacterized protein n=1 Tax=Liparis tanakae TaxID=230148 RepID=A0A4Z2ENU8_9TELE|nr:hypothetical protein EYF80_059375 [Liparis tanakae]